MIRHFDNKGRISLGKKFAGKPVLISEKDGTITVQPLNDEVEKWLNDPKIMAEILKLQQK